MYNGCCFYRSDFVIQSGLSRPDGSAVPNPFDDIDVNESTLPNALPNTKGTLAVVHWDVPDCGNSEFFINLQDNFHLNVPTYGGYAVFAKVELDDDLSWAVIDKIAKNIAETEGEKVEILNVVCL